jgi:hypothetical protein
VNLPPTLQAYLDAWNAGDAVRLMHLFAVDATIVDNGNRVPDIPAWCRYQARVAKAGAREVFTALQVGGNKSVVVHYILTLPDGGQKRGVDHFFLNERGQIRMLVWTTRP